VSSSRFIKIPENWNNGMQIRYLYPVSKYCGDEECPLLGCGAV
jgi:hypothetical protein